MPAQRLIDFLDEHNVKYVCIRHSMAFTALDIAKSAQISSKEMAKSLVVSVNGKSAITVVPAAYKIDLRLLQDAFDTDDVSLTGENQFARLFPDCEIGAMPPFGNLYDMDTYVAESMTEHNWIAFNAGSHSEIIRMPYKNFEALAQPRFVLLAA